MKHDPEYIGTQPTKQPKNKEKPLQKSGWCMAFGLHAEDASYNCEEYSPFPCECPCHAGLEPDVIYPSRE